MSEVLELLLEVRKIGERALPIQGLGKLDQAIRLLQEDMPRGALTQEEMFERSFQRPSNYFSLTGSEQWDIDKKLGILDWDGTHMTEAERARYHAHYDAKKPPIR